MTELIIKLSKGFRVPNVIESLTSYEWELLINSYAELLTKHETKNIKPSIQDNTIANILQTHDRYADGIITNTDNNLLFKWKQLKCMIEVKNKKILTVSDMEKFTHDVTELASTINCAIFVSLNTDIFPGRSRETIQVDFISGVVVIYTYLNHNEAIHYIIACLEKIISSNATTSQQTNLLTKYFTDYYNFINSTRLFFEKNIISKTKEIRTLEKQLAVCNSAYEEVYPDYLKLADLKQSTEEDEESEQEITENVSSINLDNVDEALATIKEIYLKLTMEKKPNTLNPLLTTLSISKSALNKLGGYDQITTDAKLEYTSTIITPTIIGKLLKYKETNGSYPTRIVLVKKFVPDASIRKLSKVIKTKKILEYIYEFCDAHVDEAQIEEPETTLNPEPAVIKRKSKTVIDEPTD